MSDFHLNDPAPRSRALGEIARIQAGYFSRRRVVASSLGSHRLIQAKDVSADSRIKWSGVVSFDPERKAELYEVSYGDILLPARGHSHRAVLIMENLQNTLASNVFYIIRPRPDLVRPSYLKWWLNSPECQAKLRARSSGTGIPFIKRQNLAELMVHLPRMEIQMQIEVINSLCDRYAGIQDRLNEKRNDLIQVVCRKAVRS